jgi:endonuclease IV
MAKNGIGVHILKGVFNDITDSIKYYSNFFRVNVFQIFLAGPQSMKMNNIDEKGLQKYLKANKRSALYVHSSYLSNLWYRTPNKGKMKVMMLHIVDQIMTAERVGAFGIVFHILKAKPESLMGKLTLFHNFFIKNDISIEILLEMTAVIPGVGSLESPEKINHFTGLLKKNFGSRFRFVIDTSHVYAGKYPIKTYADGVRFLSAIKYPSMIGLIHLNGNQFSCKNGAKDKHAIPMSKKDKIWGGMKYKDTAVYAFVQWAKKHRIDLIYERHGEKKYETNKNDIEIKKFLEKIRQKK